MPSIASHIACATYLKDKLNIKNELEFYRGSIYPDLINRGHFGEIYKRYYVPSIKKFIKKYKNKENDFYLGYLSHLLLDRYYVINFVDKKVSFKGVLTRGIYKDYDKMNNRILNHFNFNKTLISEITSMNNHKVNKSLLKRNSKYFYTKSSDLKTKYIDYDEYILFLNNVFEVILGDLEEISSKY